MNEDPVGKDVDDGRTPSKPVQGKSAINGISFVSALFTLLTFAKDSIEVVDFMVKNVLLSVLISIVLLTLFAVGLAPRAGTSIGALLLATGKRLRELSQAHDGKKIFPLIRRLVLVGAVALVLLCLVKVYVSGVYYILLESSPDQNLTMARAVELNGILARQGSGLEAEVNTPLAGSQHYAITVGPIFDQAEANLTLSLLQNVLGAEMREDAGVKKVTFRNIWRKATGVWGRSLA